MQNELSSLWDGLNPHLLARFWAVKQTAPHVWQRIDEGEDAPMVAAPLSEASLEISLNWQSPFENSDTDNAAPTLAAMMQSGALQPLADAVMPNSAAKDNVQDYMKQFEGRTGLTKLNSTQIFQGMPPLKITVTALFRAWKSPKSEVHAPFEQLMRWALPVELSHDGGMLARAAQTAQGQMGHIQALMPSISPVRVAMQYKGRIFCPLVIESVSVPLSSPVDADGQFVQLAVPMTLCSLTAIDRADWSNSRVVNL